MTGSDEIGGPMVDESETATLCITCEEDEGQPNECPKSGRPCGHHCNHTWTHDSCCWCDAEFGESA